MGWIHSKKWAAVAIAVVAPLSLSGCLILPGEFVSDMTVRQNGDFSFSYKGQIQLVGLANLLNSDFAGDAGKEEFKAVCFSERIEPASDNDGLKIEVDRDDVAATDFKAVPASYWSTLAAHDMQSKVDEVSKAAEEAAQAAADAAAAADSWTSEERECTPAEVKQQKADWDLAQAEKKKRDEQDRKMAAAMLGGIDPENPETIKRFTRELERLSAWKKVEHLGNGVFMVDYSTSGRLADDYAFPVIPHYALGEPMVYLNRWDDGRLRVEAPAFRNDPETSLSALMGMGGMANGMLGKTSEKAPTKPLEIKGIFTLMTDARILANNSEDGPDETGPLAKLTWDIGPAAYGAPMALLKMAN